MSFGKTLLIASIISAAIGVGLAMFELEDEKKTEEKRQKRYKKKFKQEDYEEGSSDTFEAEFRKVD